jgi:hypothetical protein
MNTQRPEWNDANNALVGYGLSVVTLGYLRRFVTFFQSLIKDQTNEISLHSEVAGLLRNIGVVLQNFHSNLDEEFTPESRLEMMNYLGKAGSDYRMGIYESGFSGSFSQISIEELSDFLVRTKSTLIIVCVPTGVQICSITLTICCVLKLVLPMWTDW